MNVDNVLIHEGCPLTQVKHSKTAYVHPLTIAVYVTGLCSLIRSKRWAVHSFEMFAQLMPCHGWWPSWTVTNTRWYSSWISLFDIRWGTYNFNHTSFLKSHSITWWPVWRRRQCYTFPFSSTTSNESSTISIERVRSDPFGFMRWTGPKRNLSNYAWTNQPGPCVPSTNVAQS